MNRIRFVAVDSSFYRLVLSLSPMWRFVLCPVLGLIFSTLTLFAQTAGTGALAGAISDPSGASVAGAQVKATNEARGEVRTAISNASGTYILALLPPGLYELEVSRQGFKLVRASHLHVDITETTTFNLRMELGQIADRVVVEAHAEQLQTQSSTLGEVTSGEQVRNLPLVTRNYTQIISLNPG